MGVGAHKSSDGLIQRVRDTMATEPAIEDTRPCRLPSGRQLTAALWRRMHNDHVADLLLRLDVAVCIDDFVE